MDEAARKIRVSPDVMAMWDKARTSDGYLLTWAWGEPDADGFYEPAITRHEDDQLVPALTPERLGAALHRAYCTENRPMHSHPTHSADAILRAIR